MEGGALPPRQAHDQGPIFILISSTYKKAINLEHKADVHRLPIRFSM